MPLYSPVFSSPVSAIAQVAARRRTALQRTPLARACAGLLLASLAATASAQQAPAAQGEASPTALDTVTVTAEHREQNLQEVPVSVGVVQGAAMRDYTAGGDDTLLALSGRVPGFYAETTTGASSRVSISVAWAISISTWVPRSRCPSSRTMWCWSMSCSNPIRSMT